MVDLPGESYEQAVDLFEWDLPTDYNIAEDFLRKHEDPRGQIALLQGYPDGRRKAFSFHDIDQITNKMANGLRELGIEHGDRVAIVSPQKPEALFTHLSCWKLGAISVPLSLLFGTDAIAYRLQDSGAKAIIADAMAMETIEAVVPTCSSVEQVVEIDGDESSDSLTFQDITVEQSRQFDTVETTPDTPAIILYTSGTTGPPKGVLHTHGVWIGQCPAYGMYFGHGDPLTEIVDELVIYGYGEWAWIGTLGYTAFPAWHYGRPIVAYPQQGFDVDTTFSILEEFGVTHAMFVPTALRMMMATGVDPTAYELDLHTIVAGSEPVTPEIREWVEDAFEDVTLNEGYGQTEVTGPVATCDAWFTSRPGSMGKLVPGSDVTLLDPNTYESVETGEIGVIAIHRSEHHPGIFDEFWNDPDRTAESMHHDWHLTGDLARMDDDGYIWFESRSDDLIISSGYRISPREVEQAILEHDAVTQAGVIGVPDERIGERIKAFVESTTENEEVLLGEIQQTVNNTLAKYARPHAIEVIDTLPKTVTGKIKRNELRERPTGGSND